MKLEKRTIEYYDYDDVIRLLSIQDNFLVKIFEEKYFEMEISNNEPFWIGSSNFPSYIWEQMLKAFELPSDTGDLYMIHFW